MKEFLYPFLIVVGVVGVWQAYVWFFLLAKTIKFGRVAMIAGERAKAEGKDVQTEVRLAVERAKAADADENKIPYLRQKALSSIIALLGIGTISRLFLLTMGSSIIPVTLQSTIGWLHIGLHVLAALPFLPVIISPQDEQRLPSWILSVVFLLNFLMIASGFAFIFITAPPTLPSSNF